MRRFLEERGYPLLTEAEESAMKAEAEKKEAADQQAKRDHELALTKAKGGSDDEEKPPAKK